MTGRSVPLWVGKTPDDAIPPRVRLRIWEREGGRCWITGRKIMPGEPWDLDHKIPLCLGGRHAEDNLFPALRDAHREKTSEDVGMKAKADRIRQKHLGIYPRSKRPLKSRGFESSRRKAAQEAGADPVESVTAIAGEIRNGRG